MFERAQRDYYTFYGRCFSQMLYINSGLKNCDHGVYLGTINHVQPSKTRLNVKRYLLIFAIFYLVTVGPSNLSNLAKNLQEHSTQ